MYEKQINNTYFRELFGSIFIYVLVLFISVWIARDMQAGWLRTAIAICPMVPVLGALWAVVRHFRRIDEYMRQWSLENMAIAGGITAIFSLTYGFMEGIGFPRLSMFVIWGIFMGGWGLLTCIRKKIED
ncbi:hypothetical protein AAKU67_001264 [Oxalobacteraceae bacterium GrIS 2.11]